MINRNSVLQNPTPVLIKILHKLGMQENFFELRFIKLHSQATYLTVKVGCILLKLGMPVECLLPFVLCSTVMTFQPVYLGKKKEIKDILISRAKIIFIHNNMALDPQTFQKMQEKCYYKYCIQLHSIGLVSRKQLYFCISYGEYILRLLVGILKCEQLRILYHFFSLHAYR